MCLCWTCQDEGYPRSRAGCAGRSRVEAIADMYVLEQFAACQDAEIRELLGGLDGAG